jgi:hypothetical protein
VFISVLPGYVQANWQRNQNPMFDPKAQVLVADMKENMTPISSHVHPESSKLAYYQRAFGILFGEERLISDFKLAASVLVLACVFAGSTDAGAAMAQFSATRPPAAPSHMPKNESAADPQLGKNSGGASLGEGRNTTGCVRPGAGGNNDVANCPPSVTTKGPNSTGGNNVVPPPRPRALPCIGYPDRQCL